MRDAFVKKITDLASLDKDLLLLTADLGFGIFDNFRKLHPNQFINIGVAEQNMISIGTGLALEGKKIFAYSIGNFGTLRCLEQIRNDAAYHNANLKVVSSGGGFTYGQLGMSHHATEDLSIMRSLPGVITIAPGNAWESEKATEALYKSSGVGYLRLEKEEGINPPDKNSNFQIGKSINYRFGNDLTIFCIGGILSEALLAGKLLAKEGIETSIFSMHTIKPIDVETVLAEAKRTKRILTVEENNIIGGLGSAISEIIATTNHKIKFSRIGINDTYTSIVGDQEYLRDYYKINSKFIYKKAIELVNQEENDF